MERGGEILKNGKSKKSVSFSPIAQFESRLKAWQAGLGWIKLDQTKLTGSYGLGGVGMDELFRGVVSSFVKQDWFRQASEDLWHLDRDYFCNHFGKAHLCGQGPSLDKEVKGELVQLLNNWLQ